MTCRHWSKVACEQLLVFFFFFFSKLSYGDPDFFGRRKHFFRCPVGSSQTVVPLRCDFPQFCEPKIAVTLSLLASAWGIAQSDAGIDRLNVHRQIKAVFDGFKMYNMFFLKYRKTNSDQDDFATCHSVLGARHYSVDNIGGDQRCRQVWWAWAVDLSSLLDGHQLLGWM